MLNKILEMLTNAYVGLEKVFNIVVTLDWVSAIMFSVFFLYGPFNY